MQKYEYCIPNSATITPWFFSKPKGVNFPNPNNSENAGTWHKINAIHFIYQTVIHYF